MPYNVESPLAAGLGAAGGYMAGVNEKKQRQQELARQAQLDAQAQADTAARLGLERSNQEATQAYRTSDLEIKRQNAAREQAITDRQAAADAETARRKKLSDLFDQRKLVYPANWDKMPVEGKYGKIAYLEVRRAAAAQSYDDAGVKAAERAMENVRTEAEQAKRDAHQDALLANTVRHQGVTEGQGNQRITISLDRAANAASRGSSTAGDPQALADVSGRLAHAKNRDQAQTILDSQEASLLSDRQYARLQKQVDETYGTHAQSSGTYGQTHGTYTQTHPSTKEKFRNLNPDEIRQLQKLGSAIPNAPDPVAALHKLAQQWNLPLDQAAGFVP